MKKIRKVIIAGVLTMGLLSLLGCGNIIDPPACGGKVDNSYKAPKTIESENVTSFTAKFYKYCADPDDPTYISYGRDFMLDAHLGEDGKVTLKETHCLDIECEADASVMDEIYQVLKKYDLFKANGTDCYTAGLPPEYQPMWLDADFDSKENLYFRENGDPQMPWCAEIADIFAAAFEKAGDSTMKDVLHGKPLELGDAKVSEVIYNEMGSYMEPWYHVVDMDGEYWCYASYNDDGTDLMCSFMISDEEAENFFKGLVNVGVLNWNGFNQSVSLEPGILDGDCRFEFEMILDDGRDIYATGYNSFPDNYGKMRELMFTVFDGRGTEE